jgi:hypothetical protein
LRLRRLLILRITEQKIEKSGLRRAGRQGRDRQCAGKHGYVRDRVLAATQTHHGETPLEA